MYAYYVLCGILVLVLSYAVVLTSTLSGTFQDGGVPQRPVSFGAQLGQTSPERWYVKICLQFTHVSFVVCGFRFHSYSDSLGADLIGNEFQVT